MAELFGFSIKKSSKESGPNEKTFVSPTPDDGSIEVAGGGFFGQILKKTPLFKENPPLLSTEFQQGGVFFKR